MTTILRHYVIGCCIELELGHFVLFCSIQMRGDLVLTFSRQLWRDALSTDVS